MGERIELGDIDVVLGASVYYPINRNELSDISATPYFCGKFPTEVKLNRHRTTVLKFKVGGLDRREIRGRVKRPGNTLSTMFCIKGENGNACETVETKCKVEIDRSNADDVGRWYLTIWYKGRPANKASERRTVIV